MNKTALNLHCNSEGKHVHQALQTLYKPEHVTYIQQLSDVSPLAWPLERVWWAAASAQKFWRDNKAI